MSSRYEYTCCLVVFMFVWVERIVMSSAYIVLFCCLVVPDVYILNSVDESTPPCRTPVFIVTCVDFVLLYS